MRFYWQFILTATLSLTSCFDGNPNNASGDSNGIPQEVFAGGEATVFDSSPLAFSLKIKGLNNAEQDSFFVGNSLFNKNWVQAPASTTARDGLGPFFNTMSCSACHFKDGRGRPPFPNEESVGLLFRLSIPGEDAHGGPLGDPIFGGQLSPKAITGTEAEGKVEISYQEISGTYRDGTTYSLRKPKYTLISGTYGDFHSNIMVSPRVAQQVFGLGLLESIPEGDLINAEDPEDQNHDGISGKLNWVWDIEAQKKALGRIGWKANQPNLKQQTAGAFQGDIGITSSLFTSENHTAIPLLDSLPSGAAPGEYELDDKALSQTVFYLRTLAVPAKRNFDNPRFASGKEIFTQISCHLCHTPEQRTLEAPTTTLSNQTFYPYTDLLLHDMGEDLADHRPDYLATGTEWRTPPLWGIGLLDVVNGHQNLLHDGRARDVAEAILWHGGEGENSKNQFLNLSTSERENLIFFVNSL